MVDQSIHISNCVSPVLSFIVAVALSSRQISQHKITILAKIWRLRFIDKCASKITFISTALQVIRFLKILSST